MGIGEPNLSGYKRQVTAELGMHAREGYAVYTELFLSTTPWKDLAEKVVAMQTDGQRPVSNIAAWYNLRRDLLTEFNESDPGNEHNTWHS